MADDFMDLYNAAQSKPKAGTMDAGEAMGAWRDTLNDAGWSWDKSFLNPKNWFGGLSLGNKVYDAISGSNLANEGKIAYTSTGIPYDSSNIDSQINALMQEYANKRDDESYDRLIAALKRNGINPALALSNNASPLSSDSGYRSNYNMTTKDQVNSALKVGAILAVLLKLLA